MRKLWRKPLANPVKLAIFSYDATLVASIGVYDRLVKVWERLSFGSEDVQFGFSYLPHPRAVTELHWRRPFHREETIESVLYTLCADSVLRVWAHVQSQDQGVLQLWAAIDLSSCIPAPFTESTTGPEFITPTMTVDVSAVRHALILDSRVFTGAAEAAVRTAGTSEKQIENLNRLTEIAARNPEIVVVFDGKGRMSALGLDNVGNKNRISTNVFHIVTGETSELMGGVRGGGIGTYLHFVAFSSNKQGSGGQSLWSNCGMFELISISQAWSYCPISLTVRYIGSTLAWMNCSTRHQGNNASSSEAHGLAIPAPSRRLYEQRMAKQFCRQPIRGSI